MAELPAAEAEKPHDPELENTLAVRITRSRLSMEIYSGALPETVAALCKVLENAP